MSANQHDGEPASVVSGGKGVVVGRRNIQNNNFFSLWPSRRFVAPEFSPVPDLAGRASELAALADAFAGNLSRPTVRVLTGESGVGKSALAAAHGRRHHDRYGSMVWIDARDPDQIAELCRNVLNVVAPGEADVDNPVDVLLHGYLANQDKRWLLVMDDVRHPNLIRRLIPAAGAGDVIVTSAATGWRDHVAIDVGPLGFEAATSLLLPPAGASPEPVARALAAFLGGSPRELIRARETLAANPAVDWTDYLRLDSTGQADTYATNSDHAAQVTGRAHRNCVAAGSLQEGHQELFVVDRDRRLVHRWNDLEQPHGPRARSGWSRWWLMNEPEPVHRVGCSSLDAGHLEVFAVTDDQGLIHRWREGSPARWSPWRVLATPGKIIALDVGSARDGSQDLFVVTTDGHVYTRGFDRDRGDWTGWVGFGAPEPVVGVAWSGMNRSRGHRELFAVTKSGRVLHRWNHLDAGEDWSDWADMDAPGRVRSATAGSPRRAQQDLIVVLGDGTVFSRRYGRTGHEWDPEWTSMSALEPIVAITSSSLTTGHLELFATTVHGALLHRWYWASTGWSEWELFERAPQTP